MGFEDFYLSGLEYVRASLEEYGLVNRDAELMSSERFREYAKEQYFEYPEATPKECADELVYQYREWQGDF